MEIQLITIESRPRTIEEKFEDLFVELIKDLEIKKDLEYFSHSIFWFEKNKCVIQYDFRKNEIWFKHRKFTEFIKNELNLEYEEIRFFMKTVVSKHLKINNTNQVFSNYYSTTLVEKHFNTLTVETDRQFFDIRLDM